MAVSVGEVRGQVRTTGCCALIFNEINKNAIIKVQARARTIKRGIRARKADAAAMERTFRRPLSGEEQVPCLWQGGLTGTRSGDAVAFKPVVSDQGNVCCTGHCDRAKMKGKDGHCMG
jgi:hypothetical protein